MKKLLWFFGLISFKDHQAKIEAKEKSMVKLRSDLMEVCNNPDSFESLSIIQKYKAKEGYTIRAKMDYNFFSPKDGIFL